MSETNKKSKSLVTPNNSPRNAECKKENMCDVLYIELSNEKSIIPSHGTQFAAGYDIYAYSDIVIPPWSSALIGTGVKMVIPTGMYGRIAARSGLSVKKNIDVGAGIIDSDYRGEIKVLLRNQSDNEVVISYGTACAQLIIQKYESLPVVKVNEIDNKTERGDGGFGSTDKK